MSFWGLFSQLKRFIQPYHPLIIATLILALVAALLGQVNALMLKYIVDAISALVEQGESLQKGLSLLFWVSVILLGKEVFLVVAQFGQRYFGERLRILISKDLVEAMVAKILTYQVSFFTHNDNEAGRLQTRIDRSITSITRLIQHGLIILLPIIVSAAIALIILFYSNIYVGFIGLSVIPLYFYISHRQVKRLREKRRMIRKLRENQSQGIISIIEFITVIKSFNREQRELDRQLAIQDELVVSESHVRKLDYYYDGAKTFVNQLGIVLVIIVSTYLAMIGEISLGSIMLNVMLFNNVSAPIRQSQRIYDEMNENLIYAESYFEVLNAFDESEITGDYQQKALRGHFELKEVSFTYPRSEKEVLHHINMTIEPNKITALVGLSGAGKSTLINLLEKFYTPDSGIILLDGMPLEQYDVEFLRNHIGLVLQKNHIFNGSIEDNIRYGDPKASMEKIVEASKKAYIHDEIMTLPDGYASSALALSGGQQQRIAIARMFLKDPPIIFLDEPTASLDAVASEQIKNSLDAIKKDRTVIIISHNISQIIDADYMYVLEDGHLVESGTHETIYAQKGAYANIFDAMARSLNIEKISGIVRSN